MFPSVADMDRCPVHSSYMTIVWPFLTWQSKLICTHCVCQMLSLYCTGSLLQISPHPFSLQNLNLYTLLSFSACGKWNSNVDSTNGERQLIEDQISHYNRREIMCALSSEVGHKKDMNILWIRSDLLLYVLTQETFLHMNI
jgi:hypothetical protein